MKPKKALLYLVLLFLLIPISGCVFLRLLEVKRQLNDFDSYFRINDQKGFTITFLKPVLHTDDVLWIAKRPPTSKEENGQVEVWTYLFEKDYKGPKDEDGNFDLPIAMSFEKDKLSEIRFPDRFLKALSKPLLAKMFRSMGNAEISKWNRTASSMFQGMDSLEIPKREQIAMILGKPFETKDDKQDPMFTYRYGLKNSASNLNAKVFNLFMMFTFAQADQRLLKVQGNFSRLKVSMDFAVNESDGTKNGKSK
ncbi:MAG TPA: hypothetical protein VH878_04735 [Thermodesulfobacteriota bacterium]